MLAWIKQYPWVIAIMLIGLFTFMALQRRSDLIERKVEFIQTALHTDSVASELAKSTAVRDSIAAYNDSISLYNQGVIMEKLDSVLRGE